MYNASKRYKTEYPVLYFNIKICVCLYQTYFVFCCKHNEPLLSVKMYMR